jgi:hypothetical protein
LAGAVTAALWLIGLLAAAPALHTGQRYGAAERVRDALVLGVAIPFVLGFFHVLYPVACWIALGCCIVIAYRRRALQRLDVAPDPVPYLLVAALALVAWPQLMRPLLDGDSLSYHLPNAGAWVQAHGVWTTGPRYWWYPPGSELFAAGLYAVSGPFAVGWSGLAALALVGFRIVAWTRTQWAAPPLLADALAAAAVTAAPLALQAGTLQNDVWLAAFFLETLWTIRREPGAAMRTIAIAALIKPYGWIFAIVAALAARAPWKVWLAGAAAIAFWIAHDVILWNQAIVSAASTSSANTWQTTIVAHGLPALGLLARVSLLTSPFTLIALLAAAAGPVIARDGERDLGWAALAAAVLFLLMPLAYADLHPQLATGASLRYAAPAIVLGTLLLTRIALLAPRIAIVLLIVSSAFGAISVAALYWNDAPTRTAFGVALLAVGIVAGGRVLRSPWPVAAGVATAIAASWILAARHPIDYYSDALSADGKRSGVYAWIARTQPAAVGGWGLRLGTVDVLSPETRVLDLPEADACAAARRQNVLLVAVAEPDRTPRFNALRLRDARACGSVRYDDGVAVVVGS